MKNKLFVVIALISTTLSFAQSVQSSGRIQSHYKTLMFPELRWQSLKTESGFSRRLWCKINSNKRKVDANTLWHCFKQQSFTSAALAYAC
jgi:hypothetical protein